MDGSDDQPLLCAAPATHREVYPHFGKVHNGGNQAAGRALATWCHSGARLSQAPDGTAVYAKPYINREAPW
jgi:hypothetical protein